MSGDAVITIAFYSNNLITLYSFYYTSVVNAATREEEDLIARFGCGEESSLRLIVAGRVHTARARAALWLTQHFHSQGCAEAM